MACNNNNKPNSLSASDCIVEALKDKKVLSQITKALGPYLEKYVDELVEKNTLVKNINELKSKTLISLNNMMLLLKKMLPARRNWKSR